MLIPPHRVGLVGPATPDPESCRHAPALAALGMDEDISQT